MKEKRILTDCDGVLLNWFGGFEEWLMKNHSLKLDPVINGVYHVEHRIPGKTSTEGQQLALDFSRSDYISHLKPERDSVLYVKKLHELGYTFHCITAIEDHPDIYERRLHNIRTHFGDAVDELTLVGTLNSKIEYLTKYRDTGRWWIEDSISNAKDGHELGLETILLTHRHTESFMHDDIHAVDTWEKVFDVIVGGTNETGL